MRAKLMKMLLGAFAALLMALPALGQGTLVLFGSSGKGFTAFRFDAATARFESLGVMGSEIERPTALAVDPAHRFLYVTSELGNDGKADGAIFSFRLDGRAGTLQPLNKVMAGGGGTTYLAVDKSGSVLIANNFGGGQVAAFKLNADGSIGARSAFVQHVDPAASRRPHPHHTVIAADNRHVLVPDLGLDRIYTYLLDAKSGTLTPGTPPFATVAESFGPRHMVLLPNEQFAFAIEETVAGITRLTYNKANGELKAQETISLLPEGFSGTKSGAEIWVAPSGRFVYASSRSDDTLLAYAVEPKEGRLRLIERVPAQGKSPRSFGVDPSGRYLLVCNQQSNSVAVFKIDAASGKLLDTGQRLDVPTPSSVLFVPVR